LFKKTEILLLSNPIENFTNSITLYLTSREIFIQKICELQTVNVTSSRLSSLQQQANQRRNIFYVAK